MWCMSTGMPLGHVIALRAYLIYKIKEEEALAEVSEAQALEELAKEHGIHRETLWGPFTQPIGLGSP